METITGKKISNKPSFIPRPFSALNDKSVKTLLTKYGGIPCTLSEYLDGLNVAFYRKDDHYGVCSNNAEIQQDKENIIAKISDVSKISERLESWSDAYGDDLAVQGKLIGSNILNNYYKLRGNSLYIESIYNISRSSYMTPSETNRFCRCEDTVLSQYPGLQRTPYITSFSLRDDLQSYLAKYKAQHRSKINKERYCKGLIIQSSYLTLDQELGYLAFKSMNPSVKPAKKEKPVEKKRQHTPVRLHTAQSDIRAFIPDPYYSQSSAGQVISTRFITPEALSEMRMTSGSFHVAYSSVSPDRVVIRPATTEVVEEIQQGVTAPNVIEERLDSAQPALIEPSGNVTLQDGQPIINDYRAFRRFIRIPR